MKLNRFLLIGAVFVSGMYCSPSRRTTSAGTSLKEYFKDDFAVGAALNALQLDGKDAAAKPLILKHFNAITPENVMKSEVIHPAWGKYDFYYADKIVSFGKKHHLPVHGHTLVWHSQLSAFAKQIGSVDSFRNFFNDHITTVASRYNGKVTSWDVVNEALDEDGSMRKSIFLQKLGNSYVIEAFRLAQKASPDAALYYNDYNNEQPAKRAGCIKLIQSIQAAGVRIDGVGIQGHWHTGKVPFKEIEESIEAYAALGLKVMITELDLEVLPRNFSGADVNMRVASNPALNPYATKIPESVLQQQASDYAELFRIFRKHKNHIARVTVWGVHDGQSWLNDWPVKGRTNYPLLFDRQGNPKPAFNTIIGIK